METPAAVLTVLDGVSRSTVASVLLPPVLAFIIGIWLAPGLIRFLCRHKLWRQTGSVTDISGRPAPITAKLHNDGKRKVPRMGGLVIIAATVLTLILFWGLSHYQSSQFLSELNFVSRSQTWLPIFALLMGFFLGFLDDLLVVEKIRIRGFLRAYVGGGLSLSLRIAMVTVIGLVCGWWFFAKLGVTTIDLPFIAADLSLGVLMIPFITIVMVATYSGGVIDGIDGVAGAVFSTIFVTYAVISLLLGLFDMAAFCLVISGSIFAFLWYNIPPARFYMSETGSLGLTLALAMVAFITDTIALLPIIAAPLYWTSVSNIIQVSAKKFWGRKVFLAAPIHNHFRARGAPGHQVAMRYWVMTQVLAIGAVAIFLVGY